MHCKQYFLFCRILNYYSVFDADYPADAICFFLIEK